MARGTITSLDTPTLSLLDKVCQYRYENNMSVLGIVETLQNSGYNITKSKVAYLLKVDSDKRVQEFKQISEDSKDRASALIILVQFLRDKRKYTYNKIVEELGISKETLLNVLGTALTSDKKVKKKRSASDDRMEEYLKLNAEGKSLAEIAKKYNVSRQSVSALFKRMGYIPKTGSALTRIKIEKHAPELIQNISKDYIDSIKKLKEEKRAVAQALAVHKSWATRMLCKVRTELVKVYMEGYNGGYSEEVDRIFTNNYNTLNKYITPLKETDPTELNEVIVDAIATVDKASKFKVKNA